LKIILKGYDFSLVMKVVIFDETGKITDPETLGLNLFDSNRLKSSKTESYFEFLKKLLFITLFGLVFFFVANENFPNIIHFIGIFFIFSILILIAFFVPYFMNEVVRKITMQRVIFFILMFSGLAVCLGVII
jgi:hypothetical protein